MAANRFPTAPVFWDEPKEHLRKIANALNGSLRGETNNTVTSTLTANATSTTVIGSRITPDTIAVLQPLTASAAAATGVYVVSTAGVVTINHDSSPDTDRTFGVILIG